MCAMYVCLPYMTVYSLLSCCLCVCVLPAYLAFDVSYFTASQIGFCRLLFAMLLYVFVLCIWCCGPFVLLSIALARLP